MDKINDKRKFPCEYCCDIFTTLQNKKRHISRKHKGIDLIQQQEADNDNISVLSDNVIVSVNYQSEIDEQHEIKQIATIPDDEYLLHIISEYEKYEYLFPTLYKKIKWNKNNADVDMIYHLRKHNHKMTYLLVDIRDAKLPIN
jgi:hypothetical protein